MRRQQAMAPGHIMEAQGTGLTHSIKWKRHKWASPFPQSHRDPHSLAVGQRVPEEQDPGRQDLNCASGPSSVLPHPP